MLFKMVHSSVRLGKDFTYMKERHISKSFMSCTIMKEEINMGYEQGFWTFALNDIRIVLTASLFHILLVSKADNLNNLLFYAPLLTVTFSCYSVLIFHEVKAIYDWRVFMNRAWFCRINLGEVRG